MLPTQIRAAPFATLGLSLIVVYLVAQKFCEPTAVTASSPGRIANQPAAI
jgi:hypothetical protein